MGEVQDLITIYVSADESVEAQAEAFERIAAVVAANSMHDLIELLEEKLVSVEDRIRNRATTLLSELFGTMDLQLHGSVLHLFTVFFSHRLSDYPSVVPSLQALTILVSRHAPNFEPKYADAVDIFQTVFRSLQVPAYAQTVRYKVYLLFKVLLSEDALSSTLKPYGTEILEGIVNSMDEEKDPRCLLEVFRVLHLAMRRFHGHLTNRTLVTSTTESEQEDEHDGGMKLKADSSQMMLLSVRVFEAVNCYFPITFNPPPNDPFGITSEMLITSLEDCLCSAYGAHSGNSISAKRKHHSAELEHDVSDPNAIVRLAVPFLLDQLKANNNDDLPIARVHALRALVRIVRTNPASYGVFGLLPAPTGVSGELTRSVFGDKTTSPVGKMSAQDRALMDMVGDAEDYTDMYVQDAVARESYSDAVETPWTPAPQKEHLVRTLSTLSERLYALLTDPAQSAGPSHHGSEEDEVRTPELRVHGLTLLGAITTAMIADGRLQLRTDCSCSCYAVLLCGSLVASTVCTLTKCCVVIG
jgi:hypothetical protein